MRAGPRRKRIRNFYVAWHTWQLYYVHSHWYTLVGVVSKEVNDISHSLSFTSGYLYIFLLVTRLTLSEISEDYYLSILRCLYYLFLVPSCMKCKKWIFNYSFWHLKGKPWKCSTHGAMKIVSALPQMNRRQVLFPEYPSLWYASRTKTFTLFSLSLSLSPSRGCFTLLLRLNYLYWRTYWGQSLNRNKWESVNIFVLQSIFNLIHGS